MRQKLLTNILGAAVIVAGLSPAMAAGHLSVTGPFVDDETGGDWRGDYGSCFYLIPDARDRRDIDPVGPDMCSDAQDQYRYNNCYGGPMFNVNPNRSLVDWRVFRNDNEIAGANVFFVGDAASRPHAAQWNPCLHTFRHGTWSNGTFDSDPLSVELIFLRGGDYKLTYYFTNADYVCRGMDYSLKIDGAEWATGYVEDIAEGTYVTFDVVDMPSDAVVTLSVQDAPGDPTCDPSQMRATIPGVNSHISGVFVDSRDCTKRGRLLPGGGRSGPDAFNFGTR